MPFVRLMAILLCLIAGTGCASLRFITAEHQFGSNTPPPKLQPPGSYWIGDEVKGSPSLEIVLHEQRAYFYKGRKVVGESTISSGRKGFDTPPGHYKVTQKDKDHKSNLYGDYVDEEGAIVKRNVDVTRDPQPEGTEFRGAPMRYFMRFTGGYGMHAGYLPGYRASHGCIRLPKTMAEHFFENSSIGTPVTVEE